MKELPLPQQIEKLDAARLRAYQENLSFYQGQQWSSRPRGRERHLTFNYARSFIDKVTSYLMSGLTVAVEPWDSSPEARERAERATARLRQVAEANILEQLDLDTEIDAALLGDGCYKVTWGGEGVRVSAPDVQGVCDTVSPI